MRRKALNYEAGSPHGMEVPRSEHPRPDFQRSTWMNLNGPWQFEVDTERRGMKGGYASGRDLAGRITVPFPPESRLSGVGERGFMQSVWYRRKVKIPSEWRDGRILLHFGAVDYESWTWVNGIPVGHHKGGYSSFEYDITDAAREDEETEIVVRVFDDNRTGLQACGKQSTEPESYGCHYTRVTGIWQTVWLERVPHTYVGHFWVAPDPASGRTLMTVNVGGHPASGIIEVTVSRDGDEIAKSEAELRMPSTFLSADIAQPSLWSPDDPQLYGMKLELNTLDGGSDSVVSYFGIRSFDLRGPEIWFNGRPKFLRMVLDQGYYPDGIYTAPSDDALRNDILISKEMGFEGARLHQKVFEPRFLYWCDVLGYLVAGEYADWGAEIENPSTHESIMNEWTEVVLRDINHPSIVMWTPFNERALDKAEDTVRHFLRGMVRLTRALDPTRPVIDTSGHMHVETDIYDIHDYEQDPKEFKSHHERFGQTGLPSDLRRPKGDESAPYQGQPFLVSEYGGTWWNPDAPSDEKSWGYGERPASAEAFVERYRALTDAILSNPRASGFCYTQLYDVEQEVNGLLTYDRRPKFSVKSIREVNSRGAAIESE